MKTVVKLAVFAVVLYLALSVASQALDYIQDASSRVSEVAGNASAQVESTLSEMGDLDLSLDDLGISQD